MWRGYDYDDDPGCDLSDDHGDNDAGDDDSYDSYSDDDVEELKNNETAGVNQYYECCNCNRRVCKVCNGLEGDFGCEQENAIYEIECPVDDCHASYIGQTSRAVADRANEHGRAAANPQAKSYQNQPWARHANEHHNGESLDITVKLVEIVSGADERRARELELIRLRNPSMNTQGKPKYTGLEDLMDNLAIGEDDYDDTTY